MQEWDYDTTRKIWVFYQGENPHTDFWEEIITLRVHRSFKMGSKRSSLGVNSSGEGGGDGGKAINRVGGYDLGILAYLQSIVVQIKHFHSLCQNKVPMTS